MKICPRCDGQGLIYKAKVIKLGIILNICDECEACWFENEQIGKGNLKNYREYLISQGLSFQDTEHENLGYL